MVSTKAKEDIRNLGFGMLFSCIFVAFLLGVIFIPLYMSKAIVVRKGFQNLSTNCTIVTWTKVDMAVAASDLPCLGQRQFSLDFSWSKVGWIEPGTTIDCTVWYKCKKEKVYKAVNKNGTDQFIRHQKILFRFAVIAIAVSLSFPVAVICCCAFVALTRRHKDQSHSLQ